MNVFKSLVQRYPLAIFLILTFAISWLPALITTLVPGFSILIFAAGPSVAALIAAAIEGKTALQDLRSRAVRWRVGGGWYLVQLGVDTTAVNQARYSCTSW